MKTEPMPHEKLTEKEIKEIICYIQSFIYVFREREDDESKFKQLTEIGEQVIKLKKHFCPEKFSIMKMTIAELSEEMKNR